MIVFSLLLLALPFSKGCVPMKGDPDPCSACGRTLANTDLSEGQCAVHRTCVSCTSTTVAYAHRGECLTASVTCSNPSTTPRLRLLKTDNTYTDIDYKDIITYFACTGHGWTYTPAAGGEEIKNIKKAICFGTAEGFQESPISLSTSKAVYSTQYDASQFELKYGPGIVEKIDIHKGESAFHVYSKPGAYFTASHLDSRYLLVQYHGHWNTDTKMKGSEHTLDGKEYAAEFHFVHIREDFPDLQSAVGGNGVAVIGVLAELSPMDNPDLDPMIKSIEKFIMENKEEGEVEEDEEWFMQNPVDLIPANHNYLSYTGSLTTGLYQKCVAWNVLTTPITISQKQLDSLGKLVSVNARKEVAIKTGTVVHTSEKKGGRQQIKNEEDEEKEKEAWEQENEDGKDEEGEEIVKPSRKTTPNLQHNHDDYKEESDEEIEFTREEVAFLHALKRKYKGRRSELRSQLAAWTMQ